MRPRLRRFKSSSESGSRAGGPTHSSLGATRQVRSDKAPRAVSPVSQSETTQTDRAGMRPHLRRFKSSSESGSRAGGPTAFQPGATRQVQSDEAPRAVSPCHSPRQPDRPSRYEAAPAALHIFIGIRFEGRRPDSLQPGATRQVQE